jgi:hypothetical protein
MSTHVAVFLTKPHMGGLLLDYKFIRNKKRPQQAQVPQAFYPKEDTVESDSLVDWELDDAAGRAQRKRKPNPRFDFDENARRNQKLQKKRKEKPTSQTTLLVINQISMLR